MDRKVYDIVGKKKIYFTISFVFLIVTILYCLIFGVEVDVDFKGGAMVSYSIDKEVNLEEVEQKIGEVVGTNVTATVGETIGGSGQTLVITFADEADQDMVVKIEDSLKNDLGIENANLLDNNSVSATAGMKFFLKSLVAVAFAFIVLVLYIAWRFKKISGWSAGIVAIVALLHDVLVVFAAFAFFRLPLDDNFIAVVLTILGYSINNTIIIYDRIRENRDLYGKKKSNVELVNLSISQTLGRSFNTSLCTLIAMIVVVIVALAMNVSSIISFAFPLAVGIAVGFYTSVCFAGSLWIWWQEKKSSKTTKSA